jgi:hypothetical protein
MFVQGALKLTYVNLKAVWVQFSTLSWAVFVMRIIERHAQAQPHLELKTQPRFCLTSLSLSMLCG